MAHQLPCILQRQGDATSEVAEQYLQGCTVRQSHELIDDTLTCSFDFRQELETFRIWFSAHNYKFDSILEDLFEFTDHEVCFQHTEIDPTGECFKEYGNDLLFDLDEKGTGSKHIDLGWPFIRLFVEYKEESQTMNYRYDLALARLQGYFEHNVLTAEELHLIWSGAVYAQLAYILNYDHEKNDKLCEILTFGIAQEAEVLERLEASYLTL